MGLFSRKPAAPAEPMNIGPNPVDVGFDPKSRWEKSRLLEAVGSSHYQRDLKAAHEAAVQYKGFVVARLQHVPDSPHGNNVIAIVIGGRTVGHVAKNQARNLAPRLAKVGGFYDVLASIPGGKMYTVTAWLPNGKP